MSETQTNPLEEKWRAKAADLVFQIKVLFVANRLDTEDPDFNYIEKLIHLAMREAANDQELETLKRLTK